MAFPRSRPRLRACCAALLSLAAAPSLAAQADTLTGRVIAADSTPIPHATVRATSAGGREQAATSDAAGRYLLVVPAGEGPYALQASAFGYLPFTAVVEIGPGTGRTTRDFRLNARPVMLEEVRVVADAPAGPERAAPAERGERWDAFLSHLYPLDPGDFAAVGAIVPGAVSSGDGLSLAGQSSDQNAVTVDGATFGGGSLPSEGVRSVGVFGTTYEVSRGQFSGGQIAASTIGGTNLWGGAVTAQLDGPGLRSGGPPASLAGERRQLVRLSAGGGGALVRDRLFVYGALDLSRASSDLPALDRLDSAALFRLAVEPASAERLRQVAGRVGAIPPGRPSLDEAENDAMRGLARLDWAIPRGGSLTARLDWRGFALSGLGASPFRLSGGTARVRSGDAGLLLQHQTIRGNAANALRVYRSSGHTRTAENDDFPTGVVRVSSLLDDGAGGSAILSFGGVGGLPDERRGLWEAGDELKVAAGAHQVQAGVVVQEETAAREAFATAGTFTFDDLDDLEHGRASSFTRLLDDAPGEAVRRYAAAYLGDTWRPREWTALVYGVRVEGSRYVARPDLAPGLEAVAGTAGARIPDDVAVTPRVGFTTRLGAWVVEGGAGGFAGLPPLAQLAPRWAQTGSAGRVLSCVGPAAPAAEWARYAADPASIPGACAGGSRVFAGAAPAVTVFDPGYGGARTWRASLSGRRGLTGSWGATLSALLVHGTGLPTAVERNLRASPAFTLDAEGGRPVYAAPEEIDPGSGSVAPGAGRILPGFGAVEALGSRGESWTAQLVLDVNGVMRRGTLLSARYTFTHGRILSSGIAAPGAPMAGTAGDPGRLEWMDAPFTPRHHVYASTTFRPTRRLRLAAIGMLRSGLPFTPLVGGDVNGDGRANDRAFLFAPDAAPDAALAAGMRRLREDGPAGVRRCLRAGQGRIAAAGACSTPWSLSLDLRAELTPWGSLTARRFVVGIDARNLTAGLDHLLHGADGLRGWGQTAIPDTRLLEVRGFDPASRTFRYDVNPRFGRPASGGMQRDPFRLVLEGRITVGADPRYQPLMQAVELGSGRSRESVRAELATRLRNVPAAILQLDSVDRAALALSVAQRAFLRAAADSLSPHFTAVVDSLAAAFTAPAQAPTVRAARVQEASLRAATLQEAAIERARAILAPEQWARLPAWLTRPAETADLQRSPRFQMDVP